MGPIPSPPPEMAVMNPALQQQFLSMQYPPVVLLGAYAIWIAIRHKSIVPVFIYLGGGLAYLAEPLVNVLGLVWFPQEGLQAVWGTLGRKVPLFGFLAYLWFLGGMTVILYDRLRSGLTGRGIWIAYGIFVLAECILEIPGLQIGAFTYYGNQPFVVAKFPLWWAFVNAAAPIVAGVLCYRMLPLIAPPLRFVALYAVCFSNALVMGGSAFPLFFALNAPAGPLVTHLVGVLTIATACFFVYMAALCAGQLQRAQKSPEFPSDLR